MCVGGWWRGLASGKEQTNNTANLLKYAVHGRGATKPPAPVSPLTASLATVIDNGENTSPEMLSVDIHYLSEADESVTETPISCSFLPGPI